MGKPRISTAAVLAAYEVLDSTAVPANYYTVSSDEQRRMRLAIVQQALIAAALTEKVGENHE